MVDFSSLHVQLAARKGNEESAILLSRAQKQQRAINVFSKRHATPHALCRHGDDTQVFRILCAAKETAA
jgi:hypothetical protein